MLYKGMGAALKVAEMGILRCDKSLINPKFMNTQHNNAVALKTYLAARRQIPIQTVEQQVNIDQVGVGQQAD
jgi:hypothetical protein